MNWNGKKKKKEKHFCQRSPGNSSSDEDTSISIVGAWDLSAIPKETHYFPRCFALVFTLFCNSCFVYVLLFLSYYPCMLDDWRYHSKEPYKYINRKRYYFYHLHRDKRQVFIFSNRRNYRWSIIHRKPNKYKNRSQHRWQSMRKVVIASQKHMYSR